MPSSNPPAPAAATTSAAAGHRRIHVELGHRGYDVMIGADLIADAGKLIAGALGSQRCAIVTDKHLEDAGWLDELERRLESQIRVLGRIVMPPGESIKCFAGLQTVAEELLGLGIERRDVVIALGGGVIGDLAGFAASILRRGVRFVQIPTSLLAQVDSSVGGKTGINTVQGKNLIGAFHQPSLVLADIGTLTTLSDRQLRAGYAEVVKHAALGDAAYFDWLEANVSGVLQRQPAALAHAVARSVEMKAEIVARDETEQGDRMLLNLGHTFGHAFEAWAGYSDRLLHGEAVALGTSIAFRFSAARGLCSAGAAQRVCDHFKAAGLPTRIADIPGTPGPAIADLLRLMAQDKKVQAGRMTFILARGIGEAFISREVEPSDVEAWLSHEMTSAG